MPLAAADMEDVRLLTTSPMHCHDTYLAVVPVCVEHDD